MCDYDIYPNDCKTNSEIKDYIATNGINFNVYYIESQVQVKNYTYPLQQVPGLFYKYFDTDKYKVIEYLLQQDKLITDSGFLLPDQTTEYFFNAEEFSVDTLDFDLIEKKLIGYYLYASNKSDEHFRKYVKIPDILAYVGGLLKIFPLIFSLN